MSTKPLEEPQRFVHRWRLDEDTWAQLYVSQALTKERIAKLRRYLDLALSEADAPYEEPEEGSPRGKP